MPKGKSSDGISEKDRIHPYHKTLCSHGKTHGDGRKEWEDATCPICMDFPHNAVLLVCSSHDKGCRPYVCNTGNLHSNCLNQYKKAHMGAQKVVGHSEPPPPGISMAASDEAINLTVEALSVTFVTVSPENGVVVSSRNLSSLDESGGIGITSATLNSLRDNGDVVAPYSDIIIRGPIVAMNRRDSSTPGVDGRSGIPTSGMDGRRDGLTSETDERRGVDSSAEMDGTRGDSSGMALDEPRPVLTSGMDVSRHEQAQGVEEGSHLQTWAMDEGQEMDERLEQTSEIDGRHIRISEMEQRNGYTIATDNGYELTSAINEMEELPSALDERRHDHTSVMDESQERTSEMEERHDQTLSSEEMYGQTSMIDERHEQSSSIDERHPRSSSRDETHVHTTEVDERDINTLEANGRNERISAVDAMEPSVRVSHVANLEASPLHVDNDNVNGYDDNTDADDDSNDVVDGDGDDECMDEDADWEWNEDLKCPLCRGVVSGWKVVGAAREHLNHKARSCSEESCSFFGTYKELRMHAKSKHPFAHPSEIDPFRLRDWRRLEHQRNVGDVLSSIRAAMPGATIVGDHVLETGSEENENDGENGNSGGALLNVPAFLFLHLFAPSTDLGGRIVLPGAWGLRGHRGSGGTRGRQQRELELDIDINDADDPDASARGRQARELELDIDINDADNPDTSSSMSGSSEEQVPGLPPYE